MEKNELIEIVQLPIIKTYLENLSLEIKEKVDKATSLVCTPENYKEIKEVRTKLNKEFQELEAQRKKVKNAIMGKYNEFEEIYKQNVSNLYEEADENLKKKIEDSTYILIGQKLEQIRNFAEEHIKFNHLESIVKFEDIPIKVTLSCSMKSLETTTLDFIKKVSNDLECISSDENRDELLYEYQHNGFDYSKAVLTIKKKQEELKKIKEQQEKVEATKIDEVQVAEVVEEIIAPKEIEEKEKWTFTFEATKSEALDIKCYLESRGIEIL